MNAPVISSIHNVLARVFALVVSLRELNVRARAHSHSVQKPQLMRLNTKRYKVCIAYVIVSQSIYIHQNAMPFKLRLGLCFSISSFKFNFRSI